MLIDPLNTAALNNQTKSSPTGTAGKTASQPQPTPALAQTGGAGLPVVASFTAAALLTSRALSAADQTAEQNAVKKKEEKKQEQSKRHPADWETTTGSLLDTKV